MRPVPDSHHTPELTRRAPRDSETCRCGTRLGTQPLLIEVTNLTPALSPLFRGQTFCSVSCLRAFFLESLTLLDGIDTPVGEAQVSDLRATYADLALAFAELLEDWSLRNSP